MGNNKSPLYIQYQCFLTLSILHCFTAARAITPDEQDDPLENTPDAPDLPPSPLSPKGHGRQSRQRPCNLLNLLLFWPE